MKLILLLIFAASCLADEFDKGFIDYNPDIDQGGGKNRNIIGEREFKSKWIGKFKLQFQVKKKDEFYDLCLRMPVVVVGKWVKAIKGCIGMNIKVKRDNGEELYFRMRAGSLSMGRETVSRDKAMSLRKCFEVHTLLGEICVSDMSWDHQEDANCRGGVRKKFCATLASIKFGRASESCVIFCGGRMQKYRQKWVKWNEEEED